VEGSHWARASYSGRTGHSLGEQAISPNQIGQTISATVAREVLRVAVVCNNYPQIQVSKQKCSDIQRVIVRLVDELHEERLTPRLVVSYWDKGAAVMICHYESTKDYLAAMVPTLVI